MSGSRPRVREVLTRRGLGRLAQRPRRHRARPRHRAARRAQERRRRSPCLAWLTPSTGRSSRSLRGCSTRCCTHRGRVGPDHRGRGVRRPERPRLACLPGPHPAQRGRCSGRPVSSTSTSPTACTTAPTSSVGPEGSPSAVLLRAGRGGRWTSSTPRARRAVPPDRDLARGPARLCQALGLTSATTGSTWPVTSRSARRLPRWHRTSRRAAAGSRATVAVLGAGRPYGVGVPAGCATLPPHSTTPGCRSGLPGVTTPPVSTTTSGPGPGRGSACRGKAAHEPATAQE